MQLHEVFVTCNRFCRAQLFYSACLFVCPSVCLLQAGMPSGGKCSQDHSVFIISSPGTLGLLRPTCIPWTQRNTLCEGFKRHWRG